MLGIIVELAVSGLLLWLIEKKSLGVLGLVPNRRRIIQFGILFLVGVICCASGFFLRMSYEF